MSSDTSSSNLDTVIQPSILKIEALEAEDCHLIKEWVVWRALFANVCISGIKLVCWFFTLSAAMLAEAIHSAADAFNSFCLLIGLKRCRRPADKFHPFGYGLETNVWALFACVFMFIGSVTAVYHGFEKIFYHPGGIQDLLNNYVFIAVVLIISIMFELWCLASASKAVVDEAKVESCGFFDTYLKSIKYVKKIKSPTTKFVWYEESAALLGVVLALFALTLSKYFMEVTYAHIPDGIASILIGLLLLSLAIYLLRYNINFLTGASAKPDIEENIKEIARTIHGISDVIDLKTIDMGSSGLIINMEIEVDPDIQVKDADDIADRLESRLKEKIKDVSHVTIEVQANEAEEDWREKLDKVIDEGKQHEIINSHEAKMLSRFFDFTDTVVHEIMIPRTEVVFVNSQAHIDELTQTIIESGHTRIPVYEENIDNIIGIVNAKEVLKVINNGVDKNSVNIKNLLREVIIVPENKKISILLNEFIMKKEQISVIVDEHGGVAGIVTVEDIMEEIVGEIWDEYDIPVAEIVQVDENTLSIYTKADIHDLNERFDLDLPTEDFNTLGGLIFGQIGREPEIGDEITIGDIIMKVEEMDGHKITKAILHRPDGFIDNQSLEE